MQSQRKERSVGSSGLQDGANIKIDNLKSNLKPRAGKSSGIPSSGSSNVLKSKLAKLQERYDRSVKEINDLKI